ncbi:MAG: DUF1003 domain-containing protein [Candidatus Eremiobacteraeota bacterium]|nr:DUF1003 domain-containing protein [Candidatus Eremiobacteraeota bacterium]MBV8721792.1 DUF1003 domain-containing protein [Candidatus Eremiobacteraeota bacterium]
MMHDVKPPAGTSLEDHPALNDVNAIHAEQLSVTERLCQRIAAGTGAPITLLAVIVFQIIWIIVGQITKMDPFPFVFMLTVSNVVQLVLIVVVAVAGKQQAQHDAIRADEDHAALSRLLYHHQTQEMLLVQIAEKLGVDTADLRSTISDLAQPQ